MNTLRDDILLPFAAEVLKACFCNVDCSELLSKLQQKINICDLTEGCRERTLYLRRLLEDTISDSYRGNQYFRQELENYIVYFLDSFSKPTPSIYDVLFSFSDKMIIRSNNKYCFRYEYTDIWRDFSRAVDEEIVLVSAALTDSIRRKSNIPLMDFSYCINCDSAEIRSMLQRDGGTSENHFHLRGSSPYFYISWIYLMNHVDQPDFEDKISDIENNPLMRSGRGFNREPLAVLWKKAAAIRLFLYYCISAESDEDLGGDGFHKLFPKDDILSFLFIKNASVFPTTQLQERVEHCYCRFFSNRKKNKQYKSADFEDEVEYIDYAQMHKNVRNHLNKKYFNLQGERNFLQEVLKKIRSEHGKDSWIAKLFYVYLAIKHRFHQELVQSNTRIGFYNFLEYQSRKDYFIPWSYAVEKSVAADTISSIIDDIQIHSVELRITPEKSSLEIWKIIRTYESAIGRALEQTKNAKPQIENFFYTFHFIKFADKSFEDRVCRNYLARQTAHTQLTAIINFLETNPKSELSNRNQGLAEKIYGIDAAGEEMNCRPEVFGVVFRYLQYYMPIKLNRQLKATYHVAEDNYDVVDALRAIDEAILFLNLRSGCRLGHATLLGIAADEYYRMKNNCISMPSQIWLDNVVWLYYFIKENGITFQGCALLLEYLRSEFLQSFHDIYSSETAFGRVKDKFAKKGVYEPHFGMEEYYQSWLLRGDAPELYETGFLEKISSFEEKYEYCNSTEKIEYARKCTEACYLYYLYQFRKNVKDKGNRIVVKQLPGYFIKGVLRVQDRMCHKISVHGIGIETNPTSNLFISTIKNYSKHPASSFFTNGLQRNSNKTQLNISVNTDDKSVFSTSLSNEYTYLLYYLEQEKDENGNSLYTRFEIMQWLDEIRKMGNEQSFAN